MSSPILIYGAGGHGRVVAETALRAGHRVSGFLDANPALHGTFIMGLPIQPLPGTRDGAAQLQAASVALALGCNHARQAAAEALVRLNLPLATILSADAVISSTAAIGPGTVVMPGAIINAGAVLGRGVIVNTGAIVEHDCSLGDFVHLSPRAVLGGGVAVGALTHIALGAIVLPRLQVGAGSIVGAGSTVTRDLASGVTAFGSPARVQPARRNHPS